MELDREEARASFSAIASVDLHTADTFLAVSDVGTLGKRLFSR